jgi:hypothetical protein
VSDLPERIAAAERQAHAALAIAEDPLGPRALARDHILAGWRLLAADENVVGPKGPEAADVDLAHANLPYTTNAAAARLRALQPDDDPLRAATDLARAVAAAQRQHDLAPRRPHWRPIVATALGLLALAALVAIAVQADDDGRDGPWRAQYFANPELEGTPAIERREGDVHFYWRRRAPADGIPSDGFSARFETCLVLPDAVPEAAFQIASDDGARVLVDGNLVVDDWSAHHYRSRGEIVPLDAGAHRLTVEHFDLDREATIVLVASLDGDVPDVIPPRFLRLPDEDGSCAPK